MAEKDSPAVVHDAADQKESGKNKVADYLAAPRKKRKSYVVTALGRGIPSDLGLGIEQLIKSQFKALAFSQVQNADELLKIFNRQMVLLVIDDEFADLDKVLNFVSEMKKKKNNGGVPVLFLTRDPATLINNYNQAMMPYHEVDDYVNYLDASKQEIGSRIRHAINNRNRRRGRRYQVDLEISYTSLGDPNARKGRVLDLSIHGILLRDMNNQIFRDADQVIMSLPTTGILKRHLGDFLNLPGRIRRVGILGTIAGISFEHMSDNQFKLLTEYLTNLVTSYNTQRSSQSRLRAAQSA